MQSTPGKVQSFLPDIVEREPECKMDDDSQKPSNSTRNTNVNFIGTDGHSNVSGGTVSGAVNPTVNINTIYNGSVPTYVKDVPNVEPQTKRLQESRAVPDEALDMVANKLGKKWKQLGRKLGLCDGEIDNLEYDNHVCGYYEVSYQMVLKWRNQGHPVTLRHLADKLVEIGRRDLASDLSTFLEK